MIEKKDKKESKKYDSMSDKGPAWHGKDPLGDTIGEALEQAQDILRKMKGGKGKGKGGMIMIEIEKKDK